MVLVLRNSNGLVVMSSDIVLSAGGSQSLVPASGCRNEGVTSYREQNQNGYLQNTVPWGIVARFSGVPTTTRYGGTHQSQCLGGGDRRVGSSVSSIAT